MKFEWDETKAAINRKKHGVSFEEANTVFDNPLALIFDYITSTLASVEIFKSCYIALLSNASFTEISNDEQKLDRAYKEAEVLIRGLRQYVEERTITPE